MLTAIEFKQLRKDPTARRMATLALARQDFWEYCQLTKPRFYKAEREYLKDLCYKMEAFYKQNDKRFLIVNIAPRFGKSLTAQTFTEWLFGKDPLTKIMTASYNERLSAIFARNVRNTIQTEKVDDHIVYGDIFPATKVKYGEASAAMWSLEGVNQVSYLATSPTGTATGMGCDWLIVDDIIKNAEEAYNENVLESHWEWFNNTMMQRLEGSNWKVIIIMTRWANNDLAGRIIEAYADDVELITYKAVQDDGTMLCDDILTKDDYLLKTKEMNIDIAEANYNQKPIDVKGRLYSEFKEWETLPSPDFGEVFNFTDTADTGSDYLASFSVLFSHNEAYIIDLLHTDEPMEITERETARLLNSSKVTNARIESNNGGRGFRRNVERILRETYGNYECQFSDVTQTKNKESRILASSAWVQNHVYFPQGWSHRYPDAYKQVMSYQRKGRNAHDDAVDVLASIYEYATSQTEVELLDKSSVGLGVRGIQRRPSYWS